MCIIRKINRTATIQAIMDKCNSGIGLSIKIDEFNKKISAPDGDKFLVEAAGFCDVEVVYE